MAPVYFVTQPAGQALTAQVVQVHHLAHAQPVPPVTQGNIKTHAEASTPARVATVAAVRWAKKGIAGVVRQPVTV